MNELPIPPAAEADPNARELARVWAAGGKQHVTLNVLWPDPAAWGIFLVDLAKHVANAYEQSEDMQRAEVLARIKTLFDAEWAKATSQVTGRVV